MIILDALLGVGLAVLVSSVMWRLMPRSWAGRAPKDRAQRQGGSGHFLVLVGPDRCRCGASWPCLDSVPADRRTISA